MISEVPATEGAGPATRLATGRLRPRFIALPTADVRRLQAGGPDANGQPPERFISDGDGVPCRHCLTDVAAGAPCLVLSYLPFPCLQPDAQCGPIFLHAEPCARYVAEAVPPPKLLARRQLLIRADSADDRIVDGTGRLVAGGQLAEAAAERLARTEVAYVHVRCATNDCYQCRIARG